MSLDESDDAPFCSQTTNLVMIIPRYHDRRYIPVIILAEDGQGFRHLPVLFLYIPFIENPRGLAWVHQRPSCATRDAPDFPQWDAILVVRSM